MVMVETYTEKDFLAKPPEVNVFLYQVVYDILFKDGDKRPISITSEFYEDGESVHIDYDCDLVSISLKDSDVSARVFRFIISEDELQSVGEFSGDINTIDVAKLINFVIVRL